MGLKCQFIIKMDTHKLFSFNDGDGNFTNVNLNFLLCVRKMWFFWVCLQTIISKNWNKSYRNMLNNNGPLQNSKENFRPRTVSTIQFHSLLPFSMSVIVLEKEYLPPKHEV